MTSAPPEPPRRGRVIEVPNFSDPPKRRREDRSPQLNDLAQGRPSVRRGIARAIAGVVGLIVMGVVVTLTIIMTVTALDLTESSSDRAAAEKRISEFRTAVAQRDSGTSMSLIGTLRDATTFDRIERASDAYLAGVTCIPDTVESGFLSRTNERTFQVVTNYRCEHGTLYESIAVRLTSGGVWKVSNFEVFHQP